MAPARLEPATPRSRVKHSTTELPDHCRNGMCKMMIPKPHLNVNAHVSSYARGLNFDLRLNLHQQAAKANLL